jgi:argininosuccinate lyase
MESSVTLLLKKRLNQRKTATGKRDQPPDVIHSARLGAFSASAAKYTSSIDIDKRILDAVIEISLAHIVILSRQKIIPKTVAKQVIAALTSIPRDFKLSDFLEDVHMNIEDFVISRAGKEAGGMLNLAKSRNDQVATALRIALRQDLLILASELVSLEHVLLGRARQTASVIMPGYTHLQRAQPITVGHHLLAYEEAFERDLDRILECYSRVNKCPMGAGALASSGFSLDRSTLASLLGFDGLVQNSLDAVSARDFAIESIYVCAQIMDDISKLAEEIVLWTSKEFSFAVISDEFAATSSMMPQKKNAIVPEVARARTSQVLGDLVAALGIVRALPLSYNLDLQELSRNLWSAIDKTQNTLILFSEMISGLEFNEEVLRQAVESDESLFATEVADYIVSKYSVPFRDAHSRVGTLIRHAESLGYLNKAFTGTPEKDIASFLGKPITKEEMAKLVDANAVLSKRTSLGSPNPKLVKQGCKSHAALISKYRTKLNQLQRKLLVGKKKLKASIDREIGTPFAIMNENELHDTTNAKKKSISEIQSKTEVK